MRDTAYADANYLFLLHLLPIKPRSSYTDNKQPITKPPSDIMIDEITLSSRMLVKQMNTITTIKTQLEYQINHNKQSKQTIKEHQGLISITCPE